MLTIVLDKDLECTIVYVKCDCGYDGYHETHLIVTVYSELVPSRLGRQNEDKAARAVHMDLAMLGTLEKYPARVTKHRHFEEIKIEMRELLAMCEPAWFVGLVWNGLGLSRPEGSVMSFCVSVNAGQLLFTEPYLLRLPAVEDSDWNKSGSAGLLLPRNFFLYHFRRLGLSWKKIAKGDTMCSLLEFRSIGYSVQLTLWTWMQAGPRVYDELVEERLWVQLDQHECELVKRPVLRLGVQRFGGF
ncbi:hypothetical protein F511_37697 [Dorcoceras hygrometricum]|uniref:Uncharacterized protein n=1 Tax=Dorcoceras hygrometricum TaxID=472368 RepID=A0A2Z7BLZ0_9LAMI|nr:hypothetical protein F511_37697 [Dorcoceras hygrometricum]